MNKIQGLTKQEVDSLKAAHKVNITKTKITKSYPKILFDNIFTLFNGINFLICSALIAVKAWKDLFFILIILMNMAIAIFQEIKAKRLVDKLTVLHSAKVKVLRDYELVEIDVSEIVLGDVILLEGGMQVPCDSVIVEGFLELNESMLTGESDLIKKTLEEKILSGCAVVSGKAYCKVVAVGKDNFASSLTLKAKKLKKVNSLLLQSMRKVTFISTISIIPLGIILVLEAFFLRHASFTILIPQTAGALLGMLPKGIVFLTSVSLASGIIKLSKKDILIQDIYSLENLSRVDYLCLDKTGTITTGKMSVKKVIKVTNLDDYNRKNIIGAFFKYSIDNNETFKAIQEKFKDESDYELEKVVPFSSERKYSLVSLTNGINVCLGAYDKLVLEDKHNVSKYLKKGYRILALGTLKDENKIKDPNNFELFYIIVLEDEIRSGAKETIEYFKNENLGVKIISGDNPITVSSIAKKVGLINYRSVVDMSKIKDEEIKYIVEKYDIFSRVSPNQKKLIVDALHEKKKKVAMTGDGINDILALKEADCSIALASGSDASKQISQVVLLDSDFTNIPQILLEGRRVVNNVTRSSEIFFIKTLYSALLTIFCIFLNLPFPFLPFMITFIDFACEAFPAFLTILDPSYHKVSKGFFAPVLKRAIPNALAVSLGILSLMVFNRLGYISSDYVRTIGYMILATITMKAVFTSFMPLSKWRMIVLALMVLGVIFAILVFNKLLSLTLPNDYLLEGALAIISFFGLSVIFNHISDWLCQKKLIKYFEK